MLATSWPCDTFNRCASGQSVSATKPPAPQRCDKRAVTLRGGKGDVLRPRCHPAWWQG